MERRPVLIYDADCSFCRRWVKRWQARTGDRVIYAPAHGQLRSVELVEPHRSHVHGAEAVFRVLERAPGRHPIVRFLRLPIVRTLAEAAYRLIARRRRTASRIDRLLFGRSLAPTSTRLVRAAFLRGLGLVYLIAFSSLRRQIPGLFGRNGIVPLEESLAPLKQVPARRRWSSMPTLLWLGASDRRLDRLCLAGQACSVALVCGVAPRLAAAGAWALYLSFVSVGDPFLHFQWDTLLLETGLDALVVAHRRRDEETAWPAVLLLRGLAFRLYFESGLCKLQSRDPTWRDLSACAYHYETQPLPTRLAWWAHQLPPRFQRLSTALTLGIELGAPFTAILPRRPRLAGFALLASLQTLIAATGNFAFFNVLTLVLSLWLLDDGALAKLARLRVGPARRPSRWRWAAALVGAVPLVALQATELKARLRPLRHRRLRRMLGRGMAMHMVSSYGLFARMTCGRPEIVVEGSDDGVHWRAYEFRYKPGDVRRPPRLAAPHQPRLDWQMWFAALGEPPAWFGSFIARLLEGRREVLKLLAKNPFRQHPPRYVRALLYAYRMTDVATRRATGAWWRRELIGLYFPPCSLASAR